MIRHAKPTALALAIALGLARPAPALAQWVQLILVARPPGSRVAADRPVYARLGEQVRLFAVFQRGKGRRARYYTDAPALRLRGRKIPGKRLHPWAGLGATSVRWQRVEPQPHHVDTDPPNPGNPAYSNAILFGKRHGKWLGFDTLEYGEDDIPGARTSSLTITRVSPSNARVNVHGGLGTMRYRVLVRLDGEELGSPGSGEITRQGISRHVMRVTFRSGDSLAGHLRGYFNVPNVFGSAGGSGGKHQAARYQGADCADVLIGAARAAGAKLPYTSVAGLQAHTVKLTPRLLLRKDGLFSEDGLARATLKMTGDLRSGDLMLIDYKGFDGSPRGWDHIAMVDQDAGKPGEFDPDDKVLHMGYLYGLTEAPAHTEGPAYVQFRRLKKKYWRQMQRRKRSLQPRAARQAR